MHTVTEKMGLTPSFYHGRHQVRATCSSCGKHGFINVKSAAHGHVPELVTRKFRDIGWEIDGHKKHKCPSCQEVMPKLVDVMSPDVRLVFANPVFSAKSFTPVVSEERSMDQPNVFEVKPVQVNKPMPHLTSQARVDLANRIGRHPDWVDVRKRYGVMNAMHLKRAELISAAKELGFELPKDRMGDVMPAKPPSNKGKELVRISLKEQIAIADLLKQHLKPDGDKHWKYEGDWTDAKIAQASGTRAKEDQVIAVRKAAFGPLKRGVGHTNLTGNRPHEKMAALTARVDELEKLYLELSEKMNG